MLQCTLGYLTQFERDKARTQYQAAKELYQIQMDEQQKKLADHNAMPGGIDPPMVDEQAPDEEAPVDEQ